MCFVWQYAFSLAKFSTHSIFSALWLHTSAFSLGVGVSFHADAFDWSMSTGVDHGMRSENYLQELVLIFHPVASGDVTEVISLGRNLL